MYACTLIKFRRALKKLNHSAETFQIKIRTELRDEREPLSNQKYTIYEQSTTRATTKIQNINAKTKTDMNHFQQRNQNYGNPTKRKEEAEK